MNQKTSICSSNFIKKAIAILCIMFTIVGVLSPNMIKPITSNADSESYYCSFDGGTTGYTNKSVTSYSVSASWISVSLQGYGSFLITVKPSYNISSSLSSRYGYVTFKKNSSVLRTVRIYQTNPYLSITTPSVTVPNRDNGTAYIHVKSNVQFNYSLNDQYGCLYPCRGTRGTNLGAPRYYNQYNNFDIPVTVKTKNPYDRLSWQFTVYNNKYGFSRNSTVIQEGTGEGNGVPTETNNKVTYVCKKTEGTGLSAVKRTYTLETSGITGGTVTFKMVTGGFLYLGGVDCGIYAFTFNQKGTYANQILAANEEENLDDPIISNNIGYAYASKDGGYLDVYLYKVDEDSPEKVERFEFYRQ